ncbi:MAG: hypothetical protein ABIA93_02420 [Candidatus Woesearchaeota archaeon]
MVKSHLKRISTPRTWDVRRKISKFISRPLPGGHSFDTAMSVNTALKEVLGLARTTKEVKFMLHNKQVHKDGKPMYDEKAQVGLMDVLSFPALNKQYRLILNARAKLDLLEISTKEANLKPLRVKSKVMLRGKKIQVGLSDGRTLLLGKETVKVGDTMLITVPDQKVQEVLPFEQNAAILLTAGRYAGRIGTIVKIEEEMIRFKHGNDEYETATSFAHVVGKAGKTSVKLE